MRIFFDTEFYEEQVHHITRIHLISIALFSEKGYDLQMINKDCDIERCFDDEWIVENIFRDIYENLKDAKTPNFGKFSIRHIFNKWGRSKYEMRDDIVKFCGDNPEFWAYYSSRDWVLFNSIFGGMMTMPKHFPQHCYDLKQLMDNKANSLEISIEALKRRSGFPVNNNEHNPLADAMWNKQVYEWLTTKF